MSAAAGLLRRVRRADPADEADDLATALRRWAALLRAGLTTAAAWRELARTLPACPHPEAACCLHHRVRLRAEAEALGLEGTRAAALEPPARRGRTGVRGGAGPDASPWALLEAALAAGRRAGAAPAAVALGVADALEASADAARARRSAAAGPRATARLLQWLPLGGLGMAWLLGTSPATLLSSPLGWIVGVLGLLFTVAGHAWTRLLIRRLTRDPGELEPAVVLDLVAPLLTAGRSLVVALDDLAATLPGAERLRVATALLRWGRPWEEAWASLAEDPLWAPVAAWLRPLHGSGLAGARTLAQTAAALRQQERRDDERAAEELAVGLVLPLSLCLLPAFLCWGVVPMMVALLGAGPG